MFHTELKNFAIWDVIFHDCMHLHLELDCNFTARGIFCTFLIFIQFLSLQLCFFCLTGNFAELKCEHLE